jgi:hypothetical protein
LSSFWLGGCGSYLGISHTPGIISSLVEIPQNGIQHGSFLEVFLSFIIPYFFHIHVETCEFFLQTLLGKIGSSPSLDIFSRDRWLLISCGLRGSAWQIV